MNPKGHVANLIPFKPGQSGNPGGKAKGARDRLQGDFLHALAEDFSQHGKAAIAAARTRQPSQYLRVLASLMPKELTLSDDSADDELLQLIRARLDKRRALADAAAGEAS